MEIVAIAAAIRSVSTKTLEKFGIIEAIIATTSSGRWWFLVSSAPFSPLGAAGRSLGNAKGLIVNVAARRRRKSSYSHQ